MIIHPVRIMALTLVTMLSVISVSAEEQPDPFTGSVNLGFLSTSGNTDTSSLNTGFKAVYTHGRWQHEALAAATNATEDDDTTAETYDLGWKSGWDVTARDYIFGQLDWRKDRFGAFDTQFSQTLGYGRKIIDNDIHKLNAELGAGARQSEDQVGEETDEVILTGALNYYWKWSDTSDFTQTIEVESGDDNTFTQAISSISAALVGNLSLVLSYTIRNNSEAPADRKKTDTRTAISLEYKF